MTLAIGQYDAPQEQKQPIFYLDPYRSNIAVFGAPMSGKTTFIKTLLVRLHDNMNQLPGENIYLIDFGGNIGTYGKLRNVCACFDNSNEENIKRVFLTIEKRLSENAKQLNSQSYYSVVTKSPEKAPVHMFLIIENINAFLGDERYAFYQDQLIQFCRDGLSRGLTVVITANETTGIRRLLSNFGQKIAFEMPSESYFDIFNSKVTDPMKVPGRGVANIGSGIYEFQCFLPFPVRNDENSIEELVDHTTTYPNEHIMVAFSEDLTRENLDSYCGAGYSTVCRENEIIVGLDYYEHKPVTVNIHNSRTIAIYGKRQFGKTNLLSILLDGIKNMRPDARCIFFDDGRKQLEPFYKKKKWATQELVYYTDANEFQNYLANNGYISIKLDGCIKPTVIKETPFTVFVMQSRMLFRGTQGAGPSLMKNHFPLMMANATARDFLFIFTDVPRISEVDIRAALTDNISLAFLLDNIGDFIADKGDKTAFGTMDARELKQTYAKCSIGDGYIYNVDADELQKLKFIKEDLKEFACDE